MPSELYYKCPSAKRFRDAIEHYVLCLYESDDVTLRPQNTWPGYYTRPTGPNIPCVFVEGRNLVPATWNPHGVECIIKEVPETVKSKSVGNSTSVETWEIRFTNYGAVEGTQMPATLQVIQRRICDLFGASTLSYKPRSAATFELLIARIRATTIRPPLP